VLPHGHGQLELTWSSKMARHYRISSRFSDPNLAENCTRLLTRYTVQPKEEQCTLCEAYFLHRRHPIQLWSHNPQLVSTFPSAICSSELAVASLYADTRISRMMEGEYNSMQALYNFVPAFVPKPYAWGKISVKGSRDTLLPLRIR